MSSLKKEPLTVMILSGGTSRTADVERDVSAEAEEVRT